MDQDDRAPAALALPPAGYLEWLGELKSRMRSAQLRASFAVNAELVMLYWGIGRDILERQAQQGWGAKVIERIAIDLRADFPDMKGFSRANLMNMRAFAEAWPDSQIVQQAVGQLPWGHNLALLAKVKTSELRLARVVAEVRPTRQEQAHRRRRVSAARRSSAEPRIEPPQHRTD